jgi:prepilin-type N-terminal cleavage/methylation domain-containing protein
MNKSAFTMVELIFVIVIIGILASVAIPKLSSVTDGAKKSAEIATISAVSTAIESANGEWSINEGDFTWGNHQQNSTNPLNLQGYPNDLSNNGDVFGAIIKGKNSKFTKQANLNNADYNATIFTGPASDPQNGINFTDESGYNSDIPNKPDKNDLWMYISFINPSRTCTYNSKDVFSGDFFLIDINGTATTDYNNISLACN